MSRIKPFVLLAALITIASCNSSDDSPSLAVSVDPGAIAVQPGDEIATGVILVKTNYTGTVTLSVEGLPSGVTLEYPPGVDSSETGFQFMASASATLGSYSLIIRAHGTNVADATTPLTLTVAAYVPPDLVSIVAAPDSVTLTPGGPSVTVNITPAVAAGYKGDVHLGTDGSQLISAAALGSTGGTVTLTATTGFPPGTYPVHIFGAGADSRQQVGTIIVTVT